MKSPSTWRSHSELTLSLQRPFGSSSATLALVFDGSSSGASTTAQRQQQSHLRCSISVYHLALAAAASALFASAVGVCSSSTCASLSAVAAEFSGSVSRRSICVLNFSVVDIAPRAYAPRHLPELQARTAQASLCCCSTSSDSDDGAIKLQPQPFGQ